MKALLPFNEEERTRVLDRYQILDTAAERSFDDLTQIAAQICQTPIALLSFVDRERQWFKSRIGLDVSETSRDAAFCAHTILRDDVLVVPDALEDKRFAANPLVTSDPFIRFYAGAPMINDAGFSLGSICVIDREPRRLSERQKESLKALAGQAVLLLEMKQNSSQLAEITGELEIEIGRRREHERRRLESESRYRLLFEQASDLIYTTDTEGHFLFFNATAVKLTGFDETELIGRHFLEMIRPDYRNQAAAFYCRQHAEKIPDTYFEFPALTKNGQTVWFGQSVRILFEGGVFSGFHAAARELTDLRAVQLELKQEKEFLSVVLENVGDGIVACDENGVLTFFNQTALDLHGQPQQKRLPAREWAAHYDLFYADGAAVMAVDDIPLFRALRGEKVRDAEMMIIPKNGKPRHLIANGQALHDQHGRKIGAVIAMRDVSEKRNIEQALRDSERRHRTLVEKGLGLITTHDLEGRILSINPAVARSLGYHDEDVVGRLISDLMPAGVKKLFPVYLEEIKRQKYDSGYLIMLTQTGEKRIWRYNNILVEDEESDYVLGYALDVTEQKATENALRESRELFQQFMNNSPTISFLKDEDGRYLFLNEPMGQLFRTSLEQMKGKTDFDFLPEEVAEKVTDNDRIVRKTGKMLQTVEIVPTPDGAVRHWLTSKFPVFNNEGKTYVGGVGVDITELTKSQETLEESKRFIESITEYSTSLIFVYDLIEKKNVYSNRSYSEFLGYSKDEISELGERLLAEIVHPDDLPGLIEHYAAFQQAEDKQVLESEFRARSAGGEWRWIWKREVVFRRDDDGGVRQIIGTAQDITERKRIRQELEHEKEHYQVLFESNPHPMWVYDVDTLQILDVNEKAVKSYGYGRDEFLSMTLKDLRPAEEISEFLTRVENALAGEENVHYSKHRKKDGTVIDVEINSHWIGFNGERARLVVGNDVTEQKRSETALKKSEDRFRRLATHSPIGIFQTDAAGECIFVNDRWSALTGRSAAEALGAGWSATIHPADSERIMKAWSGAVAAGREFSEEFRFLTPAGEVRYAWSEAVPCYDSADCVDGYIGTIIDLTVSKELENKLRETAALQEAILNSANYSVISTTPDGTIKSFNKTAERWLEFRADELIGQKTPELIHDLEEIKQRAREISAETGTPTPPGFDVIIDKHRSDQVIEREWTYIRRDGTRFPVHLSITALRDENGLVTGYLAVGNDITEQKRMEAELLKARDAALESARLKSEFLANMSHEIRTPMNGVIGMTELLLDTGLTREQEDFAETISSSANSLMTIINDILDFSKIEAGMLTFECIDFDLCNTVESVVELFAEPARKKKIEIASLVEADVRASLKGDPGRLRQILTNLIGNAVKFTEAGEVALTVRLEEETAESIVLRFEVTDTGIGITEQQQKLLFQAFTQADASTTRKFGGTGLGLAISKQLVELMNGAITVASVPGQGSTFSFTARFEKQDENFIKPAEGDSDLRGLRILIVDSHPSTRKALSYQTNLWGMLPNEAENGIIALELLRQAAEVGRPFDLAILETKMAGISGLDLARIIRSDQTLSDIKLILMSPQKTRGPEAQASSPVKVNGSLVKPVRPSDLLACLQEAVAELEIPAGRHRPGEAPTLENPKTTGFDSRKRTLTGRILVAEDNPVNQTVTKYLLEKLGYRSDIVTTGIEVLDALENRDYALVLMDCQMPEMDGYRAAAEIRRKETGARQIPIIALTAHALEGDRQKCLAAGMNDYLSKPVRLDSLQKTLSAWLRIEETAPLTTSAGGSVEAVAKEVFDFELLRSYRELENKGQAGLVNELIDLFIVQSENYLRSVRKGLIEKNRELVSVVIHNFKGSSANIGANSVAEACRKIEENIENPEELESLIAELEAQFELAREILNSNFAEIK